MATSHLPLHSRAQAANTQPARVARLQPATQSMRVLPVMASNEQQNEAHRSTYESFTGFTKWGTIFVVTVVLALYVFLV
jgi:hypothetical protein